MKSKILLIAVAIPLLSSCSPLMCTSSPLITIPSDFDFRFVGKWEFVPDAKIDNEKGREENVEIEKRATEEKVADKPDTRNLLDGHSIEITRDQETNTKYKAKVNVGDDSATFVFTTMQLKDRANVALLQFDKADDPLQRRFFYRYVERKEDELFLWTIQSEKLVELLKKSVTNSVIEHGIFTTEITSETEQLLQLMLDNFPLIASESPKVLRLKK